MLPAGRIELSGRTAALAAGDALAIAVFVAAGELRHGAPVLAGVDTFAQFLVGWLVVAPLAGAYSGWAIESPGRAALYAVGVWVPAALLGQVVRLYADPLVTGLAPSFVAVSLLAGGLLLAAWRGGFAAARG